MAREMKSVEKFVFFRVAGPEERKKTGEAAAFFRENRVRKWIFPCAGFILNDSEYGATNYLNGS